MRWSCTFAVVGGLLVAEPRARACPVTPLEWQQQVTQHALAPMVGQRKHTSWIRDQNRNFIDDALERNTGNPRVDVLVDLNDCLTPTTRTALLSPFGHISYVGKLLTFVQLDGVLVSDLPKLAALPQVSMVQQRPVMMPTIDIASRAVEAHKSSTYAGMSAEDQGLTGNGVTIAFIGTGVSDNTYTQLAGKRVAGFDATDPADPGDGTTDPPDTGNHESVMAVIAVGAPVSGQACRASAGAGVLPNCAGIAPGAKYVNVRQCHLVNGNSVCDSFPKAADWVAVNAKKFNIKVVNMSFSSCPDDDGTSAEAQQANYLAGLGLVVVASSSKNPNSNCMPPGMVGDRIVRAPGSASYVVTVNATNDKGSIDRSKHTRWSGYTVGPRTGFNLVYYDRYGLKPDIAVPGEALVVFKAPNLPLVSPVTGVSPAAAIVSGMAALVLEKVPLMTPDSLKQLLIDTTDRTWNKHYAPLWDWDQAWGWGLARVGTAITTATTQASDVTFPNCASSGSTAGQPCALANGQPPWNNDVDLSTSSPPRVGLQTTIDAKVTNKSANTVTAIVNFGVMIFNAGGGQFHAVGSQSVTLAPHATSTVSQVWIPASNDHSCVQVSIAFGQDADYTNNMTQRNLEVAPSTYHMRVNNPLFGAAHLEVEAKSERPDWLCTVDQPTLNFEGEDCMRDVVVDFHAPAGTPPGQQARCQVAVYAHPAGGERKLIGGVTVGTYVPKRCSIIGQVVSTAGLALAGARVSFSPPARGEKHAGLVERTATTDKDGVFTIETLPDVEQELRVAHASGAGGALTLRP
ncbi:MAG TPA: S8 family serine peptidase, partial [Polyangia bacterium]|nr:S8 family serine peptidase [Polyangia bacterium]